MDNCAILRKETGESRMSLKSYCYDPKSFACQEEKKALYSLEIRQKESGCDDHHGERIHWHWKSIAWAMTTCVSVGAIGVVVTKKIQAFNSDQDIHEAFIDNEQA